PLMLIGHRPAERVPGVVVGVRRLEKVDDSRAERGRRGAFASDATRLIHTVVTAGRMEPHSAGCATVLNIHLHPSPPPPPRGPRPPRTAAGNSTTSDVCR